MQTSVSSSLRAMIRDRPVLAFSAGFGALLAILFFDPLFLPRTFVSRDLIPFFLPIEKAVHEAWRSGHVPLLIPEISFGRPLAANPNTGAFYPVRMLMALLPFPLAFKLFPVIHIWLAGIGAFLLARFLETSRAGATAAGIAFALSGPALAEIMYPDFLPGLALMPFVIVCAGRLVRRPSGKSAAVFAIVFGLSLLVGDVFTTGLALLGSLLLTVERAETGTAFRSVLRLMAAAVPGVLLAGIQIVPALLFVPHTVRAIGRFPLRVALMWSVSLWRFLELLVPFPFGSAVRHGDTWGQSLWSGKGMGFFNTLYPGVLATLAIIGGRPRRRLFLYGLLGASVVLAVSGFYLPPAWLRQASPVPLRYPEKFMVGFSLSLAMMAGLMVDRLLAGSGAKRLSRIAMGLGIAAMMPILFPGGVRALVLRSWSPVPAEADAAVRSLPGTLIEAAAWWIGAGLLLAWTCRRSRPAAAAALLLFVVANLGALHFRFVTTGRESDALAPPPAAGIVRAVNESGRFGFLPVEDYFFGVTDSAALTSDVGAAHGIPYSFNQDYDASDLYRVDLARQQIYRDQGFWKGLPRYLAAFSARSALLETGRMPFGFSVPGPVVGQKWVVVNPAALPRFRLAAEVREVDGPAAAYAAIHDEEVDLASVTVVETGRAATYPTSGGRIRVAVDRERLVVDTETGGPSRLIFPRAWFPYRDFRVDGAAVDAAPTNLCLSSIALPPGRHRVSVEEELPGGSAGALVSVAGALSIVLLGRMGVHASA